MERGLRPAVQYVVLLLVLGESHVGIIPRPEIDESAADVLCPASSGVGEERELGVGLARLGRETKI